MARVKTIPLFTNTTKQSQSEDGGYSRKKAIADMLMSDQPKRVWSNAEGLTGVAASMLGGFLSKKAEDDKTEAEENTWKELTRVMTGGGGLGDAPSPFAASSTGTSGPNPSSSAGSVTSGGRSGGASRSAGFNERKQRAISRFVEKGYSQHAAEGIVDNLAAESSLDPLRVGDDGTAFGLAQHRGDRFKFIKDYAAKQGKPWHDFDTNIDAIDEELRNGRDQGARIAFAKLQTAGDRDTAHDIFLQHFERPSAENLRKRLRGGRNYAQAAPETQDDEMPPLDLSPYQEQARQGARLMASPNPALRRHGLQLLQQAQQQAVQAQQTYKSKQYDVARDSRKQRQSADLTREGWDRDDARKEQEIIAQAERDRLAFERKAEEPYTLAPGSARYKGSQKVAEQPRTDSGGIVVGQDENGRPMVQIGGSGSGRPPTEMNQKYEQFYRRGSGANQILDETDEALAKPEAYIKEYGPQAAQDYLLSDEYKLARQAADDFLITIIRPDTGAAVTDTEFRIYGNIFLPRNGDGPALLAQKRDSRARALEALKAGMKPEQVLKLAAPDKFDGKSIVPKDLKKNKGGSGKDKYVPGYEEDGYVFQGGDPTKGENWRKK